MLYNFQLLKYAGENGVAACGVLMYVQFIFIAIFVGCAIGSAPIVGCHFGAGNWEELKNMLKKSMILMGGAGAAMAAAQLLARPLSMIFVGYDAETPGHDRAGVSDLHHGVYHCGRKYFLIVLLHGAQQQGRIDGIRLAEVTAEVCSFALSMMFLVALRKRYRYM